MEQRLLHYLQHTDISGPVELHVTLLYTATNIHHTLIHVHSVIWYLLNINPLPPISDQEKISPYNLDTILSTEAMRIK